MVIGEVAYWARVIVSDRVTRFPRLVLRLILVGSSLLCGSAVCAEPSPEGPLVVEVTGEDYHWSFRYPGEDRVLDTADDVVREGDLHLPVDVEVQLQLKSVDYIYVFSLPHIDQTKMAVPDLVFRLEFVPQAEGVFQFKGDQMCGFSHDSLKGKLVVDSQAGFSAWLADPEVAGE